MGDWSALEKILTGAGVALVLSVFVNWKLWSRYTLVADRELKFKDEKIEALTTALNASTAAMNANTTALQQFPGKVGAS